MNKRGRKEDDNGSLVTLESRCELKRSIENGQQQVFHDGERQSKTLEEMRSNSAITLIDSAVMLGKGVYGDVKRIKDEIGNTIAVVKVTGCLNTLLGDFTNSPFRAEQVEPRILNFLWNHLVDASRATPHIVAPIGQHAIIPAITQTRQYSTDSSSMENSLVYFMEMASKRDLQKHLQSIKYDRNKFELHFRVLLFQVCYTMECIFQRFPDFRHNDLKDDNIYLHSGPAEGYDQYVINGETYHVPRIGVTALVGDFDFSTIPGYMFDNYKTIEQEWYTPTYCINTRRDHGSDMYSLVSYLRQGFSSDIRSNLRATLNRLYGKAHARNYNNLRPMPGSNHRPSAKTLLKDRELFAPFLTLRPANMVNDVFVGDVVNPIVFPVTWDPRPYNLIDPTNGPPIIYTRHCPLIYPRKNGDHFNLLPSVIYYRDRCDPEDREIEEEPSLVFIEQVGMDILERMKEAYDIEPDAENEFIGYGFDPTYKEEFFETVNDLASDFILANHVPGRWWFAAYCCAFADTVYDMNIAPACQKCWDMTTWADVWEKYGDVNYTNMQILHFSMQWTWHRNMRL